jgi:serine/threonine-protein kinase
MSFFSNLRAERLITQIKSASNVQAPDTLKVAAKLKEMGAAAVEPLLGILPDADRGITQLAVEILAALADAKTLPLYFKALAAGQARIGAGVVAALSLSRGYPPTLLLDALAQPEANKAALLEVIKAHRTRISVRDLLKAAHAQEPTEKNALFRIIGEVADESSVSELIARLQGKDNTARLHIINILGRFNRPEAARALQTQAVAAENNNKLIRTAALAALARMDGPFEIALLTGMLLDGDLEIQNRAVDVLVKSRDPQIVKHLVKVLKDENENSRRAAVEVLNEVGDASSVKYLLDAIKDDDWWVRSRAGDALGRIGGRRVIDAVLQLLNDKDDNIRRTAIEIVVQTRDERAVDQLIASTRDKDWWVSERAVDALASIGSKRAVPRLVEMLQQNEAKTLPVVVRALGKLGDSQTVDLLVPLMKRTEKDIRVEVIQALALLVDERRADSLREQLGKLGADGDATVLRAAQRAITELDVRFSSGVTPMPTVEAAAAMRALRPERGDRAGGAGATSGAGQRGSTGRTLLLPEDQVAQAVHQTATSTVAKLDINTLQAGDIIEGRYKYVQRIGKGAFGTVLLVEDTVVDEQLILKFLNPNVAGDEEVMKRFVHELRYSRKITHRNVIRIYDFLFIQGNYAISMEFFPSHTLGAEIIDDKPLPLRRAVQFGIDICTGMTVAHQVGIVHRDLKPANVLINDEGLLKVVDFGVAAAQSQSDTQLTKTGYVIGSPKYMAPEQILGRKVDERADIYAVGVILYEILTGVPPYARGDHMAVMYQHVQGKARNAAEANPSLPPALAAVVMKAMSVDKTKRHQSMDELRAALEPFLQPATATA